MCVFRLDFVCRYCGSGSAGKLRGECLTRGGTLNASDPPHCVQAGRGQPWGVGQIPFSTHHGHVAGVHAVLYFAVLCFVKCCALRCAVLCCTVLCSMCCSVLYQAVMWHCAWQMCNAVIKP